MNAEQLLIDVIRPALTLLGKDGQDAEALLLGTAAQESDLHYRKQLGGGPALGLWQMEPKTHNDIFDNFLVYRPELMAVVDNARVTGGCPSDSLQHDDRYACMMARIHYMRVKAPLPTANDILGQAHYWKNHFNTVLGKGSYDDYIQHYGSHKIASLLKGNE